MVVSGAALAGELEGRNVVLGSQKSGLKFQLLHLGAVTLHFSLFQPYESRVFHFTLKKNRFREVK